MSNTKSVSCWMVIELIYALEGDYFTNEVKAVFAGPSGLIIAREGFWDGGNRWKVRFAPTEPGLWSYKVSDRFGWEETGCVESILYNGETELYRHGFIKVGPKGKYLSYADNTPFFWLGDTHWTFCVSERSDASNCEKYKSPFHAIVDRRVKQGFTVYQCNFQCTPETKEGYLPFIPYFLKGEKGWLPNIDVYRENLDLKMQYLAEKGLVIAAGVAWFHSILTAGAVDWYKMAMRYLIARYGAYPMVWTLAGEAGGYSADLRAPCVDGWRHIAREIERLDGYGHLQTAHYTNERPFPDYYQGESWFDFTLGQSGHGDYPINAKYYREHVARFPSAPFVEGEAMYEQILTLEPNGRRKATPEMLRRCAYLAIQNGACGYTYGMQGMWHFQWDKPKREEDGAGFGLSPAWYEGIDAPGGYQMGYMRSFYESVSWHRLKPLGHGCLAWDTGGGMAVALSAEELELLFMPSVSADDEMKTIVAYYGEANRFSVGFKTLVQPCYTARWFHPGTGEYALIADDIRPENGVWFAPVKPTAGDLLLVLTANK